MANVKVGANQQTNRQTNRQGKDNMSSTIVLKVSRLDHSTIHVYAQSGSAATLTTTTDTCSFGTSRLNRNYLIQQIEQALRDLFLIATDLDKLLSNNVNFMPYYPQDEAPLNPGLHTFLARGQDYLVIKQSTSIDIELAQQPHESRLQEPQSRMTLPLP
ncbi:hypothetical protein DPMN_120580 [Dreissena polymorpha]|uniref:Uncharacterized protein n=1 Tax=Dreissena polymorpha TaxID=45954 RepID=A0A9D4JS93_DREPO|nr:hypothetical protein DPMN_120580 [Dreissena polymorpha]